MTLRRSGRRMFLIGAGGFALSIPFLPSLMRRGEAQTDVIILTHDTKEGTMNGVLAQMQALPTVLAPIVRIRKEELA